MRKIIWPAGLCIILTVLLAGRLGAHEGIARYNAYMALIRQVEQRLPTATPSPTATHTPVPTSTPTPNPFADCPPLRTPTPPAGPGVHFRTNYSSYFDGERLHVAGQLENRTDKHITPIIVRVDLLSRDMRRLDRVYSYDHSSHVAPGAATCLAGTFDYIPEGVCYVQLGGNYRADVEPGPALAITDMRHEYTGGAIHLAGSIQNDQGEYVEFVRAIGTLFSGNQVVGCKSGYTRDSNLGAGQTSTFGIWFRERPYSSGTGWLLDTDGSLPFNVLSAAGELQSIQPLIIRR